jgi:hypothetical protein
MSGYLNRRGVGNPINRPVGNIIKRVSKLGMYYDDLVIKQSRAIGISEQRSGIMSRMSEHEDMYHAFAAMSMTDSSLKKNISFFDKNYVKKRDELREFAIQDEIEEILDTLSDEAVVYDKNNVFCYPSFNGDLKEEIQEEIQTVFNKIYSFFSFNDGMTAWNYFNKWLIDGYLAFEIIYDEDEKNIIGFKELDPTTLVPTVNEKDGKKMWIQYQGDGTNQRQLYDAHVIYISYSSINSPSRVSYVERLIRSFNLMRIMEHSRIIWAVTNASFKMKFVIPVGGKSKNRAKESLSKLMHNYREIIDFDDSSGHLTVNGKPMMQFHKEYWFPSKDGEQPEVETLGGDGPDLSDTEALNYFSNKLKDASKIPYSRFDKEGGITYDLTAEGLARDEMRFNKFVNRLRSIFQEILVKPLYLQMVLNHEELLDDTDFKTRLTVEYNKENYFETLKEMEILQKNFDFISNAKDSLMTQNSNFEDVPYFSHEFLIREFSGLTPEQIMANERYKEIEALEKEGYSREDSEKIADGEDKNKFKKKKTDNGEEDII